MNHYLLIREALFLCDPERAHKLTLGVLKLLGRSPLTQNAIRAMRLIPPIVSRPINLANCTVVNPVGLAAGLDKNAEALAGLFALGFGFIEVGTVTPKPQGGNSKPRLFRLPECSALINRMGFNNDGVHVVTDRVKQYRQRYLQKNMPSGVVGINIGKNATTPIDKALDDYLFCMSVAHEQADYLTINISSPNTKNLRDLQQANALRALLEPLRESCSKHNQRLGRSTPLWLKVAPDLTHEEVALMAEVIIATEMDGLIVANTTIARDTVKYHRLANEAGGLSGAPLTQAATNMVGLWRSHLPDMPIIGVGGIMSANDALDKKQAGAKAVQIYSGLIYQGPKLINDINAVWV